MPILYRVNLTGQIKVIKTSVEEYDEHTVTLRKSRGLLSTTYKVPRIGAHIIYFYSDKEARAFAVERLIVLKDKHQKALNEVTARIKELLSGE